MMRIDKYLAEMGQGTRSEIKKLIRSGRVMVDGETVKKPELKIDETTQKVSLEGKQIGYAKKDVYKRQPYNHMLEKEVLTYLAKSDLLEKDAPVSYTHLGRLGRITLEFVKEYTNE